MSEKTIGAELIAALNIALLDREAGGRLALLGAAPEWFRRLSSGDSISFPFLDNFLIDAETFWTAGAAGRLKSGLWTEADSLGHETYLEASAVCVGPRKILMIENLTLVHDEKQTVLQKARNAKLRERERRRVDKGRRL
jgi:hypothetical protein